MYYKYITHRVTTIIIALTHLTVNTMRTTKIWNDKYELY